MSDCVDGFGGNQITSIKLPTSITSIGNFAFQNNQISGELTIPEGVTSIGIAAFSRYLTLRERLSDLAEEPLRILSLNI